MKLDLKDAVFAFLSACETAKGDTEQPDQAIHLAAAMLFVGFKSIVATMW
jgi:CHAT domain-containing protein